MKKTLAQILRAAAELLAPSPAPAPRLKVGKSDVIYYKSTVAIEHEDGQPLPPLMLIRNQMAAQLSREIIFNKELYQHIEIDLRRDVTIASISFYLRPQE